MYTRIWKEPILTSAVPFVHHRILGSFDAALGRGGDPNLGTYSILLALTRPCTFEEFN
jgi:hypothetical protein